MDNAQELWNYLKTDCHFEENQFCTTYLYRKGFPGTFGLIEEKPETSAEWLALPPPGFRKLKLYWEMGHRGNILHIKNLEHLQQLFAVLGVELEPT